jgi:starch synthase
MISAYYSDIYNHFGSFNMLKAGIVRASAVNTVSPTYCEEIKTQAFGFSLDGDLRWREGALFGILNGIDYDVFNPATNQNLVKNFDLSSVKENKPANKQFLLDQFGLRQDGCRPLIAFISRLSEQKGVVLFTEVLKDLITYSDANFIILGSGEAYYQSIVQNLHDQAPDRVAVYIGYNDQLAQRIYAGADMITVPSLFEPCGLTQMIGCRYGTIPVVRETGGLKDSIKPYNEFNLSGCNGFSFAHFDYLDLKDKLYQAIAVYQHRPEHWQELIINAMSSDFSLASTSQKYLALYSKIMKEL